MLKGILSSGETKQDFETKMIPPKEGRMVAIARLKQFVIYAALVSLIVTAIELAVLINLMMDIRHFLKDERVLLSNTPSSVLFGSVTPTITPSSVVTMPVVSPLPSATIPLPPTPTSTLSIPAGACRAAVTGNEVPLYSGPASTYEVQERLYNGQGVAVMGRTGTYDWFQVFSGQFFGWVFAGSITIPSDCATIPVVPGR